MSTSLSELSPDALKRGIQELAEELGFDACRVAPGAPARHADVYRQWIEEGCHGDMGWLARGVDRRTDPELVLPGTRAIIVLAVNYFPGDPQHPPLEGRGRVARYAWGEDYHDVLEEKLKKLGEYIEEAGGNHRYYVDTGPVLERDVASEAGLGWNGKSTMQIHPRLGTWFFLAEILTTLPLPPDAPMNDHCGKCRRCIDACPTDAITRDRRLDARRCISYLTIEHRGSIPLEFRQAMGDRIFGCDDCLDACPWNRFAQASAETKFSAREFVTSWRLRDFLGLDDERFRQLFRKSPIRRTKRRGFLRNVCVALGNTGTEADLPALQAVLGDPEPLIVEHAAWAIAEIEKRVNVGARKGACPRQDGPGFPDR